MQAVGVSTSLKSKFEKEVAGTGSLLKDLTAISKPERVDIGVRVGKG